MRQRIVVVGAALAAGLALALTVLAFAPRDFRATTMLQVAPGADPRNAEVRPLLLSADVLAETYARLLDSRPFLEQIRLGLAGPLSADELDERLDAEHPERTALVELAAKGPSRQEALALADGVARSFLTLVGQLHAQRSERAESELRTRISELTGNLADIPDASRTALVEERRALQAELAGVVADDASEGTGAEIVARSAADADRTGPGTWTTIAGGLLVGLVLGLGALLLTPRRRAAEQVARSHELPPRLPAPEPEREPEPVPESPPDTTPPIVSVAAPLPNARVFGRVFLAANAYDADSGIASVQFLFSNGSPDWQPIAEVVDGRPAAEWDTTRLADGTYWLSAVAVDGAGLSTASELVPVNVANRTPARR